MHILSPSINTKPFALTFIVDIEILVINHV